MNPASAPLLQAVLPISAREAARRHLDRVHMGLESVNFFWRDSECPLDIYAVSPDEELDSVRRHIRERSRGWRNVNLIFCSETSLSPALTVFTGHGTAKQMIVKLAAYKLMRSQFYLTLDTDVVACKPFGASDLIKGGLALIDRCIPSTANWWIESGKILGIEPQLDRPRMFVTPQFLSCDIVHHLTLYLAERLDGDWIKGLLGQYSGRHPDIWTEYTLYDLFAVHNDLLSKYYDLDSEDRLQSIEDGIWYAGQFETWNPEPVVSGSRPGYFLVLQSITGHTLDFDQVHDRWLSTVRKTYPTYPFSPT